MSSGTPEEERFLEKKLKHLLGIQTDVTRQIEETALKLLIARKRREAIYRFEYKPVYMEMDVNAAN